MKKFYVFIVLLILLSSGKNLKAQTIPNADFEQWNTFTGYMNPVSWDTPNALTDVNPFNVVTTTQDTDAYSGSFAVRMEPKSILTYVIPGLLTLGTIHYNAATQQTQINGGIGFTLRPSKLKGYYKYAPATGDNCTAVIYLTTFNTENNIADTLAAGAVQISTATSTYAGFEATLEYTSILTPDTLNIIISPTNALSSQLGSVMLVDSLSLDFSGSFSVDLGNDTTIIEGNTLTLDAGLGAGYTFEWHKDSQPAIIGTAQTLDVTAQGSYSVIVKNSHGLPAFDTINVTVIQNIADIENAMMTVSPNPNKGNFRIHYPQSSKINSMQITDGSGKVITDLTQSGIQSNDLNVDAKSLKEGIYFLRVLTDKTLFFKKIVVLR
ncbi:MAG: T9SS type A sorting domain-containing protein [Bacteroidia bacterium]|nr:T9SS type A sorting domain-containing protein [Bacteroidia bacterium]